MSTLPYESRLPDVAEADVLGLIVERAEDPRLSEYWAHLLKHSPGTAQFVQEMCREKSCGDNQLYEKLFVTALETLLTLSKAAVRSEYREEAI